MYFYVKIATPPEKRHPPSKSWGPVEPHHFLKIWLEAQPPLQKGGEAGAHYVSTPKSHQKRCCLSFYLH